jgi:fibronectin type 3 domain-containing protein
VGNAEAVHTSAAAKVDKAAPTTTDDVPAGFVNHDVTVTLAPVDTGGSGVASTYYTTDGSAPTTSSPVYAGGSKPVLHVGERIRYFSTDNAGNAEMAKSADAHVDKVAPTTTDDMPTGWVGGDTPLTLTATDSGGAGVAHTYYTTNGSVPTTSSLVYDAGSRPVLHNGEQIRYFSVDAVGNAETAHDSGVALVDTTPPTTVDNISDQWSDQTISVSLSWVEDQSGLAHAYYTTDGSDPKTSPTRAEYDLASPPMLNDGQRIRYYSVDKVGNEEVAHTSLPARVDMTPPTTTDNVPAGFVSHGVTVTLSASDATTGVAATYYVVGSANFPPGDPTDLEARSQYDPANRPVLHDNQRITYYSVDALGNREPVHTSGTVKFDTYAPNEDVSAPREGATYAQFEVVHADYSCLDVQPGSGVQSCTGPVAAGAAIDTSTPGPHTFTVTGTDNVGNHDSRTVHYTVTPAPDTTAPTATIAAPADGATYAQGQSVAAHYACADERSGVKSCAGPVGDGAAVDTGTTGAHTFTVTATDNAGNIATKSAHYTVAGSSPPPAPPPPVTIDIAKLLAPFVKQLKGLSAATLAAKGKTTITQSPPVAGLLQDYVRTPARKPVVLASGSLRFTAAGAGKVTVRLTKQGKKQLRKGRAVKVVLETVFTPTGGKPVSKTQTLSLKR